MYVQEVLVLKQAEKYHFLQHPPIFQWHFYIAIKI